MNMAEINLYGFVENNGVNLIDILGLDVYSQTVYALKISKWEFETIAKENLKKTVCISLISL